MLKEQLEQLRADALARLEAVTAASELEELRVKYLGKKG